MQAAGISRVLPGIPRRVPGSFEQFEATPTPTSAVAQPMSPGVRIRA
jgi:hypothetical protein